MAQMKFKTNIHCDNCVQKITPFLNKEIEINYWQVNTNHQDNILTVEGDISFTQIQHILKDAGFKSEFLENS